MHRLLSKVPLKKYTPSVNTQKYIHHEKKYNCLNYDPIKVVISKAKGSYVWDVDGKKYLDCISAYSALNQGHLHPKIKEAMIAQMDIMTLTSRAVYNDKLGETSKYLTETFGYDKSIMANGGVETGETAIKFARRWAYLKKKVPENKAWVLFAKNNFWGRTIAACGSSDDPSRYEHFGPFDGLNFKMIPFNNLEVLENEFKANPNIAAYMLEPIQGEGGVIIPDNGYLTKVRELCTKYNVLMILDEVQTGLGRTGKMLCQDHENIKADMVCLGKALSGGYMPVSAVLGTDDVFSCITPGTHGSTYGGNPLACAVLKASVQAIVDEGMIENSEKMGKRMLNNLQSQLKDNKIVKDVRGKGLFIAIEFDSKADVTCYQLVYELLEQGLLCKQTKENVLRLAPPLIITQDETDFITNTLVTVINRHK